MCLYHTVELGKAEREQLAKQLRTVVLLWPLDKGTRLLLCPGEGGGGGGRDRERGRERGRERERGGEGKVRERGGEGWVRIFSFFHSTSLTVWSL